MLDTFRYIVCSFGVHTINGLGSCRPAKSEWVQIKKTIRYRKLPDIASKDKSKVSHGSRAAINTPIQGGAADVAMVAMIGIVRSPLLKKLGWKLLLQVLHK